MDLDKPILYIILDMLSTDFETWFDLYFEQLEPMYNIFTYTPRTLGEIDLNITAKDEIHSEFIHGGIEKAVEKLNSMVTKEAIVLGFSIGGTIAWKASLKNKNIKELFLISPTRVRLEPKKSSSKINLYFGEDDVYKPNKDWFQKMNINPILIDKSDHEMYKDSLFALALCDDIIFS